MRCKTRRLIPALVMIGCLLFLTGANFFIYPQHMVSKQQVSTRSGNDPQGPLKKTRIRHRPQYPGRIRSRNAYDQTGLLFHTPVAV